MIVYCNENNEYEIITKEDLHNRFPNTSFCDPLKQSALPNGYFIAVVDEKPNNKNVKLEKFIYNSENGITIGWKEINYSDDEIENLKKDIQSEIEKKFKDTNWAIADDVPIEIQNKYKEYRSKLWEVTNQKDYPFSVQYPEMN